MKTLKREYTIQPITIDSKSIDKFQIMENRRQIGEGQVRKLHGTIINGKNPLGVLIVNEKNGRYRLIDGNHRLEALKRFYNKKSNCDVCFECILKVFKNLTDSEERRIYTEEATRRNESHEDRLNLYKDTLTFWKLTQDKEKEFPCKVSIYSAKDSLRFRVILDSFYTIKSEMKSGYVPHHLGKDNIIEFTNELSYEDFLLLKNFVRVVQNVFGNVGDRNIFLRRQGFTPLFDIYVKNFHNKNEREVESKFRLILGKSDLIMYLNMQGREAQQKIRELMVEYMNKGIHKGKNKIV